MKRYILLVCATLMLASYTTYAGPPISGGGSGAGDFLADGTVPMTGAPIPNAANTIALGSNAAEWADLFLGDGAVIYGQNDSSATLTSSASKWTANNFGVTTALTLPQAASPTVDAAGEIAVDTTTDQLAYYGGAKRVLPYKHFVSVVIGAPAATDDVNLLKAPYGMTIIAINCIVQGTTSVTGQLQECDSAGANCADLDSDIVCDADGAADDGSLTDSAIASAGWLRWKTTSLVDTPTFLTVTATYSVVAD